MMGEVCGLGERVFLVVLPVQRPSLSTSLTGVKCVCEGSLIVSALAGCLCIAPYKW